MQGGGPTAQGSLLANPLRAPAGEAKRLLAWQGGSPKTTVVMTKSRMLVSSGWSMKNGVKSSSTVQEFDLSSEQAGEVYKEAVQEAKDTGLPWLDQEIVLKPSRQLMDLVRRSQELAAEEPATEAADVQS